MDRGQEVGSSTAVVGVAEDRCLDASLLVADELATTRQRRLHPETLRTKGLESFSLTLVHVPNPYALFPHTYVYKQIRHGKQWSFFHLAVHHFPCLTTTRNQNISHRSSTPYHEGAFLSPGVCGPRIRGLTFLGLR